MSEFLSYEVIEPPTSAGVRERALAALAQEPSGFLQLTLLGPENDISAVKFKVRQLVDSEEKGMRIGGKSSQLASIIVETSLDPEQPATARMSSET